MREEVNYYNFADNDYWFLKVNIERKQVSNAMTSIAQNICERYLKHVIDVDCKNRECTEILKTHSLKRILRFMEENLPEFRIDKEKVIPADGYYFSARYPGDDAFFVDEEDVQICWEAVEETKDAVDKYLGLEK